MSGTSLDGLSIALVRIEGIRSSLEARLVAKSTYPFPPDLHSTLLSMAEGEDFNSSLFARTHRRLGEFAAESLMELKSRTGEEVELVGFHGQTIYHEPRSAGGAMTLQIGDPSPICLLLNAPVVSDFRSMDAAAGGQGAPLVPLVDYLKYRSEQVGRAVLNVGGIANVTLLPRGVGLGELIAFDTGPGNMLIDGAVSALTGGVKRYDEGGQMARSGKVSQELLDYIRGMDDYPKLKWPKTTGRERYGRRFLHRVLERAADLNLTPNDVISTLTYYTFWTIDFHLSGANVDLGEIVVGGGGVMNEHLMSLLRGNSLRAEVKTHGDYGIDPLYWEPFSFAVLAFLTFKGQPGNVPSVTGASKRVVLGRINLPPDGARLPNCAEVEEGKV